METSASCVASSAPSSLAPSTPMAGSPHVARSPGMEARASCAASTAPRSSPPSTSAKENPPPHRAAASLSFANVT
eukprot:9311934-Pyramimonas_sp.AAC.1